MISVVHTMVLMMTSTLGTRSLRMAGTKLIGLVFLGLYLKPVVDIDVFWVLCVSAFHFLVIFLAFMWDATRGTAVVVCFVAVLRRRHRSLRRVLGGAGRGLLVL